MKISVLICTRNHAASLRLTLDALFAQIQGEESDCEVIVVDNASTDMTRLLVAEYISTLPARDYGRLRYCYEAQIGFSPAHNTAMRVAQGDILVFVEDGLCPGANWLGEIRAEFASAPSLQLLIGRFSSAGSERVEAPISTMQRQTITSFDEVAVSIGGSLALRRDTLKNVGGFDSKLGHGDASLLTEEMDFVYRALKAGCEILFVPTVIASQPLPSNLTNQPFRLSRNNCKSVLALVRKHLQWRDYSVVRVAFRALQQTMRRSKDLPQELPAVEWQARVH